MKTVSLLHLCVASLAISFLTAATQAAAQPPPATPSTTAAVPSPLLFDVRAFGATGDGTTLDSPAINKAIDAAAAAGGGTVRFPAGNYLCYTLRLKSNIALYLDAGATIIAADQPEPGTPGYDEAEPNLLNGVNNVYQDYGHSHFHNSLIWGENLENISILGPGRIWGRGLLRDGGTQPGQGNKAIALKLCRNVTLKDFTLFQAGWFSLLATGVDELTIDNLKVDTNRDGFDIDCCHNVRVSNCYVNSPQDDGICLKSSFGLGYARATENVTITNCQVSGYTMGTFLDGTYQTANNGLGGTGRIKFGTESNGGFKNITISNCVFIHCCGLALETVDGGIIEDVTINNISMQYVANSPIFIRLGSRMRGPPDTPVGIVRRINISNIVASNASSRYASLISGLPGHPIEDVNLSNIRILYNGGEGQPDPVPPSVAEMATINMALKSLLSNSDSGAQSILEKYPAFGPLPPGNGASAQPVNLDPYGRPEAEATYPEPSMFGTIPAYGLYARHVTGLTMDHIDISPMKADPRPPVMLYDVAGAQFEHVKVQSAAKVPLIMLNQVTDFSTEKFAGLPDMHRDTVTQDSFLSTAAPAAAPATAPAPSAAQ